MTVRIWGNPKTISNLNCLFSMHNWKWVNLSKMAGFNISLSLNERQSSSVKKHNKSLRLVLFFPLRCCFAGSLPFFFIDSETNESIPLYFRNVLHFFSEKNSLSKTFLVECVQEIWRETHTPLWLLIGRIFLLTREKNIVRDSDWTYHFFFSRVKTIVRSSDWLELICVRKFKT